MRVKFYFLLCLKECLFLFVTILPFSIIKVRVAGLMSDVSPERCRRKQSWPDQGTALESGWRD
jgi:hypothetical protein